LTLVSEHGHVREVDLLALAPTGLFLVEIKNFRAFVRACSLPRRR
jgi:hypothetical protein